MPASHASSVPTPRGRLAVRDWPMAGGAAPILLLHDSLGAIDLWRDFPARLAAATGRRVIAYDRLGFGRSDPSHEPLHDDFVATEAVTGVVPVLEALGIERVVLFGHSVGGGMAVHAAERLGERCAALVTESAQAFVEDRTREGILAAKRDFEDPAKFEKLVRLHGAKARWVLDAWTETWLAPSFADWSLDGVLPRVACPVLAIHGEDDEFGSAAFPRRIVAKVAGPARLALLPGIGHVPHREDPDEVLRRVAEFLSEA